MGKVKMAVQLGCITLATVGLSMQAFALDIASNVSNAACCRDASACDTKGDGVGCVSQKCIRNHIIGQILKKQNQGNSNIHFVSVFGGGFTYPTPKPGKQLYTMQTFHPNASQLQQCENYLSSHYVPTNVYENIQQRNINITETTTIEK